MLKEILWFISINLKVRLSILATVTRLGCVAIVAESQGGRKLVQRCDINAGTRINTLFRIKCKPSVSPTLSREIRVAVTERRQVTYYGMGYLPHLSIVWYSS